MKKSNNTNNCKKCNLPIIECECSDNPMLVNFFNATRKLCGNDYDKSKEYKEISKQFSYDNDNDINLDEKKISFSNSCSNFPNEDAKIVANINLKISNLMADLRPDPLGLLPSESVRSKVDRDVILPIFQEKADYQSAKILQKEELLHVLKAKAKAEAKRKAEANEDAKIVANNNLKISNLMADLRPDPLGLLPSESVRSKVDRDVILPIFQEKADYQSAKILQKEELLHVLKAEAKAEAKRKAEAKAEAKRKAEEEAKSCLQSTIKPKKIIKYIKNLSNKKRKLLLKKYYPIIIKENYFKDKQYIKYACIDEKYYTKNIHHFIDIHGKIIKCKSIYSDLKDIPPENNYAIIYDLMLFKDDSIHLIINKSLWYSLISKYINDLHNISLQI
jgi:predicted house-cleaning noncanonical NTP pyrophosphatase (MazG superfamily)